MATNRLKVEIVDDHRLIAESIATVIATRHDVVGIAVGCAAALRIAHDYTPDVVLLDISLGDEDGLSLIPDLLEMHPRISVIIVTMHDAEGFQEHSKRLGARGFLAKTVSTHELLAAIEAVSQGQSWFATVSDHTNHVRSSVDRSIHLSLRQIEVLKALQKGLGYKGIAEVLHLSENTVDVYLRRIRQRLGGQKAVDLVRLGIEHGFLTNI